MKKLAVLLFTMISIVAFAGQAIATPIYYTFSGQVKEISINGVAPDELGTVYVGQQVTYKLLIDISRGCH
ncbi:MAG: hypothetical protein JSV31_30870 [Desulfobacterales bacterium]|nr:MAG: hypothetical protein JSV31_30870 [Desulfobacterales bacterium]